MFFFEKNSVRKGINVLEHLITCAFSENDLRESMFQQRYVFYILKTSTQNVPFYSFGSMFSFVMEGEPPHPPSLLHCLHLAPFTILAVFTSFHLHCTEKQHHRIMLPLPCFTVEKVCSLWHAVLGFHLTNKIHRGLLLQHNTVTCLRVMIHFARHCSLSIVH